MRAIFLNEKIIMLAILLNIVILFLLSFDELSSYFLWFDLTDHLLTVFFLIEMIIKIQSFGWKMYIRSTWNRLDFLVIVLTSPSVVLYFFQIPNLTLLIVFRILRLAKFFRFLKFVPNLDQILKGVTRSLKASVFIFAAFFLYCVIVSLFTCYLFKDFAPQYFGNAFRSFYTIFRLFTLEGWDEIPDMFIRSKVASMPYILISTIYFVVLVISGGIFGLSIVNAIFIDEMISDNNKELEIRITALEHKIDLLLEQLDEG
ncbi:MAG: ion transporter [Microscillaceae bacterium]|nr:ion transporter [Microscillaceae bacterium]